MSPILRELLNLAGGVYALILASLRFMVVAGILLGGYRRYGKMTVKMPAKKWMHTNFGELP